MVIRRCGGVEELITDRKHEIPFKGLCSPSIYACMARFDIDYDGEGFLLIGVSI